MTTATRAMTRSGNQDERQDTAVVVGAPSRV
ncbi:hypothetical protein OK006_1436 [Actinobacteria bacterium OK006]|nr:hypothetical protein OK006_1436 [Actinobacteria bacterium OK006]